MKQFPLVIRALVIILLTISVVFCIVVTKDVLQPLVLAGLLAFLVFPVSSKLEGWKVPRIVANLIVILLSLGVVAGVFIAIAKLSSQFVSDLPHIREQTIANLTRFNDLLSDWFGISAEKQNQEIKNFLRRFLSQNLSGTAFFSATTSSIVKMAVLPVYTFLFLFYRDKFRLFMLDVGKKDRERWKKVMHQISQVTPRYIGGSLTVVLILVVVNSFGFWCIGLEQPILFGLIAALLNIIPYIGTVFGYLVALLFAITSQSLGVAGAVVIQFFIVQFIENNILTPNITGSRVKLNPLVVIVGLFVGGQLWGFVGMLVIVPILAMLKIIFENSESLKPISYLMGTRGTEKHGLSGDKVLDLIRNLWHKLRRKSDATKE